MTTITNGTDVITPILAEVMTAARASRNVIHDIIGRPDPDVSFGEAATRRGTMTLLFDSETEAAAAVTLHATPAVWTFSDPDRPTYDMSYVVGQGAIDPVLDNITREQWHVQIPYVEVLT